MTHLIDHVREVIERHPAADAADSSAGTNLSCQCGAERLSDHSRHVAEEIVASLGLRPERPVDAKHAIRYVSAWFDDELTKLEGAE